MGKILVKDERRPVLSETNLTNLAQPRSLTNYNIISKNENIQKHTHKTYDLCCFVVDLLLFCVVFVITNTLWPFSSHEDRSGFACILAATKICKKVKQIQQLLQNVHK